MGSPSNEAVVLVSVVKAQGIFMERTSLYVEVVAQQHDDAEGLPLQGDCYKCGCLRYTSTIYIPYINTNSRKMLK